MDRQVEHAAPDDVLQRAARMGPLPWSLLPPSPPPEGRSAPAPWLAGIIDGLWADLGRPDPLVVVEAGAGSGLLAAGVLAARPDCLAALRWLLVDPAPAAPDAQRAAGLVLEDPALVLGPALPGDDPDEPPVPPPGIGPLVASLADLPAGLATAVVLAVGWLSRLPEDRFEWRDGRWSEVRLAAGGPAGRLVEMLVDAGDRAPSCVASPGEGGRWAEPVAARRWLAAARRTAGAGAVVAVEGFDPLPGGGPRRPSLAHLAPGGRELPVPPGSFPNLVAVQWPMG